MCVLPSRRSNGTTPESHVLQRQRTLDWLNAVSRVPESASRRGRRISADQANVGQQEIGPWGPIIRRRRPSFFGRCALQMCRRLFMRSHDCLHPFASWPLHAGWPGIGEKVSYATWRIPH